MADYTIDLDDINYNVTVEVGSSGGAGGGGGISDIVEDTTPQLGGTLDLNGNLVGAASAADLLKLSQLTATSTELNYVDGVTSAIQTQIDGKASTSHTHTESDITDLQSYLLNVVEDTTPQLGGELDAQANNIVNLADVTFRTGASGGTLRTGTSAADKWQLQAYDTNLGQYVKVAEADAGTSPTFEVFADYFQLWDNTDETKILTFDLSGATTGTGTEFAFTQSTNRVITFPDATGTVELEGHTHTASEITDFDTEVANNSAVALNTAKVTNATHTGDATGSGALSVVGLRGVSLDSTVGSPSDGDILVYRTAGSDWVLETKPAGGSNPALNDVTDVTITSVADNEVLAYDTTSGDWINQTAAEAGLAAASHTHTASEITDFDTEVSNNTDVTANTAKVSADGSIATHSDVTITTLGVDELLFTQDGSTWINQTLSEAGIQAIPSEGAFVDGDKTKLDGIEANADVTDTANVTAAGALMDSEVDADIKTLSLPANTTISTFGASLIDDADAATARTTLGAGTLSNVSEDTSPQLGGDLDYNSNGIKITGQTVGGTNGDLVYLSGSNTWSQADADAVATTAGALGIRISASEVLLRGIYTTTGLTAGSTYYVSTTLGGITTTAPSATGDVVRIVGYALTTTEFFFNPDGTYIELA